MSDEEKRVLIQVLQDLVISVSILANKLGANAIHETLEYDLTLLADTFGVA